MAFKGIHITDSQNGFFAIRLSDILAEVGGGNFLYWSILLLNGVGYPERGCSFFDIQKKISKLKNGLFIRWDDLAFLSYKLYKLIDIVLIANQDMRLLRRFPSHQEMYENCDVVIKMVRSNHWEVFSKDENLIERLKIKFQDTHLLKPHNSRSYSRS